MKAFVTLIISFFLFQEAFSAEPFKIKGEVKNATADKVVLSLYKSWIEEPVDYVLYLDQKGQFSFETELENLAYLDFNYEFFGILFQIIEPGDDIYIELDAKDLDASFLVTGSGSAKWNYAELHRKQFQLESDMERQLEEALSLAPDQFEKFLDFKENEQLQLLEKFKRQFSEQFFTLRRADIVGYINSKRLDYPSYQKFDDLSIYHLQMINTDLQAQSFEYFHFLDELIHHWLDQRGSLHPNDFLKYYANLKGAIEIDGMSKPMIDQLICLKISDKLLNEGYSESMKSIIKDFSTFAKDQKYITFLNNELEAARNRQTGNPAPEFVLQQTNGKFLVSRDLKGKNILLYYWASYCEPCQEDLKGLSIVENFFKERKDLMIVNIAVDKDQDYVKLDENFVKPGFSVRIEPTSTMLEDYSITSLPAQILIDKNGNWLDSKLIPAGIDQGRSLIKELETIFDK